MLGLSRAATIHLFAVLLTLVASVMSAPLPVQDTDTNSTAVAATIVPFTIHDGSSTINSTSHTFLAQQPSGLGITAQTTSPAPVQVPELTSAAFPSVTATSTQVSIPPLDITTAVRLSVATSAPAVDTLFVGNGDPLSQRVLFSIIFGFALFVACYVAFCCFWRRGCCFRSRQPQRPQPPLQPPARRRPYGGLPVVRLTFPLIVTAGGIFFSRPSSRGSSRRLSSVSDITLASPTGGAREIEVGKDSDLAAEAGPSSPRLSSNMVMSLAASGRRSGDESGQDPAGDAGPSSPRSSSSGTVITLVASADGHPHSPSGRHSIADGVEMVAPTVTRPPAARHARSRPRDALMEAGGL